MAHGRHPGEELDGPGDRGERVADLMGDRGSQSPEGRHAVLELYLRLQPLELSQVLEVVNVAHGFTAAAQGRHTESQKNLTTSGILPDDFAPWPGEIRLPVNRNAGEYG